MMMSLINTIKNTTDYSQGIGVDKYNVDSKRPLRSSGMRRSSFLYQTGFPRWTHQRWPRGQAIHHSMGCPRECRSDLWLGNCKNCQILWSKYCKKLFLKPNVFSSTQVTKSSELVDPLHISWKLVNLQIMCHFFISLMSLVHQKEINQICEGENLR